MFTTLISILTVFVLAFGGSVATAYASQDDLPGDTLYPVKAFTEDARLALANDTQDVALYEEYAQRRVQEAVQLSDGSRFDDVTIAMLRYDEQLQAMNQTLVRLAAKDPAQADALAARIQAMLETQLQTLTQLRERVADPARGSIDEAVNRSREHAGVEFGGLVEAIAPDVWVISGRTVAITAQTEIKGDVVVGSLVKVHAYETSDGILTAREIELVAADTVLDFTGFVEDISGTTWIINGQTVSVNDATEIRGDIQVGDWVVAKALVGADGTLTALLIHLPNSEGTPGNGNDGNGNANGNDDDRGNDNGNQNSNQNGNDDDRGNDNGNQNSNQNGSDDDRGNDNGNQNGNDDDRGNDNGNQNSNQNGNDDDRGNDNGNQNSNQNGNDDDRGNDNGNQNSNQNGSDDDRGNDNGNQNSNQNGSDDDRGNDNGNQNSNQNGNDDDRGNDNGNQNSNQNGNDDDRGNDNGNDSGGGSSNDNGAPEDNSNDSGGGSDNGNDSSGEDDHGSLNLWRNLVM